MPSGAKKRKAAKKKKVHNSTSTNPHQGEDAGGDLSSPASQDNQTAQDPSVEVENKEANGDEGSIEIETGAKSKSSNGSSSSSSSSSDDDSSEKKEVVIESAPVESLPPPESAPDTIEDSEVSPIVDESKNEEETKELVPESLPETDKLEVSPIVDPVELDPVESSLQEVVKVYDETKKEDREELVVSETPEVVVEEDSKVALKDDISSSSVDDSVSKEDTGVLKLSTPPEGLVSETDHSHETDTVEHSDRKALVASPPIEERQMASWKNCCGIFELFSGSGR